MRTTLLIILLVFSIGLFAQNERQKLTITSFNEKIAQGVWSVKDTTKIRSDEMMKLGFEKNKIWALYFSFLDGISYSFKSKYILTIKEDIFVLDVSSFKHKGNVAFIYGYLADMQTLMILMVDVELTIDNDFFDHEDWLEYKK
jgi:hypothetical protein